jgi:hypothetical protein
LFQRALCRLVYTYSLCRRVIDFIADADIEIFSADRGYKLNYKLADDASLNIKKYGKYLFEHIVIFAPSVEELGGSLSVEALTEFVDEGGKCLFF